MLEGFILAAGLGTRLRPLTDELPKPLVPIGDRSALAHIAAAFARAGLARAVVNTHHLAGAFTEERLAEVPLPVLVVNEPEILGTAGGIANMARITGATEVIAWNGDILVDVDLAALVDARRRRGALATLAVATLPSGQGTVGVDESGAIVRLRGEMFGIEARGGDFVGVQALGRELLARMPERGCLVADGYLPALRRGERVDTFDAPEDWDDIGTIASYLRANLRWLARRGGAFFCGEGANVEGSVDITGSVVGKKAVVKGSGALKGCVIWPGSIATAPLEDAVVTAQSIVQARLRGWRGPDIPRQE